ncbi:hypothetical protein [Ideonella sp. YS5]|uniref:hypothetical protein n=1 Tax=Ideonella sp. YS5 TaxID=3453714 RepID=UPI003EECA646
MSVLFEQAVAPAAGGSAQRSAALLLHGMSEADRAWAWEQLDEIQRAALSPLLHELRELGVPRDASLLREVIAEAPRAAPRPSSARDRVANADPTQLAELLHAEPAGLVQRVLALGPWPWQSQVLASLRARRGEVLEPMAGDVHASAPALDEALLQRLAERVSGGVAPAPSVRLRWWQQMLQSVLGSKVRSAR